MLLLAGAIAVIIGAQNQNQNLPVTLAIEWVPVFAINNKYTLCDVGEVEERLSKFKQNQAWEVDR